MKIRMMQLVLVMLIGTGSAMAQSAERKAERERKRVELESAIAGLMETRNFEFRAVRAIPTEYKSVDLTTNSNFMKFSKELIVSSMPFFGKAYSVTFGGDGGIKFENKPEVYTVEKRKKDYSVEAKVNGKSDYYTIHMTVYLDGSATMNISSNNRSAISYFGEIFPSEKKEEKK